MYISWLQLSHLPVVTESGHKLGTVHDIEFDLSSHSVRKYIVTHGIKGLTKETFLITPMQIISISAEQIIVEDTIIKDTGDMLIPETPIDPALGGFAP